MDETTKKVLVNIQLEAYKMARNEAIRLEVPVGRVITAALWFWYANKDKKQEEEEEASK